MLHAGDKTPDIPEIYRFTLDLVLGEGGTGTVYRGIDKKSGNVVAVKLFHANFFRNNLHLRDLAKSVKKFRKFSHANVVEIYEFLQGDEGECMVMEYVDGPDLGWYMQNRPWNLPERMVIIAQICNGLQYLHEKGYSHHDFKPSNVLFTRRGVAKLSDFSLGGTNFILELLDTGKHEQVTPMYIAPELIRNEKATPQSDMYSLGVTMYRMFANKVPYETDNLQRLYHCHLRTDPVHPTVINKACPQPLGDIIMKLMSKKPENRFQDCDQLRIALSPIGQSRI